jgi:hypothetical protein
MLDIARLASINRADRLAILPFIACRGLTPRTSRRFRTWHQPQLTHPCGIDMYWFVINRVLGIQYLEP